LKVVAAFAHKNLIESDKEKEEEEIYLAQTKIQLIDNIIQLSQVARKPYWSTMLAT